MSIARRVAWNTSSQALARIGSLALGLLTTVLLTRHLGADGYGAFVAATAYVALLAAFADWGIATIVVREISHRWESAVGLLGNALALRVAIALPVIGLAALALPLVFDQADSRHAAAVALPAILAVTISTTLMAAFQATLTMGRAAVAELASQVLTAALVVGLVVTGRGLSAVVAAFVIGLFAQAVLLAFLARRLLRVAPRLERAVWRSLIGTALPLGMALVLNTLYFRIDAILLAALSGAEEVGYYGVAWRFLEMVVAFPAFFVISVFPLLSAAVRAGNGDDVVRVAQRAFDVLVVGAVAVAVGGALTAPSLVALLAGEGFSEAVLPLRIVAIGAALMFVNGLLGYLLIAADRQRDALWLNVLVLVVNVVANVVLIPAYGANAAAAVATASELLILVGSTWMVMRFLRFVPSLRTTVKALVAGAAMAAVVVLLDGPLALDVAVGAGVYVACLLALRLDRDLHLADLVVRAAAARPERSPCSHMQP